jgi:hypothetical protein
MAELGDSKPLQWRTATMTEDEFKAKLGIPADWPLISVEMSVLDHVVTIFASAEGVDS